MGSPDQVDAKAFIDPEIVELLLKRFGVENLETLARAVDQIASETGHGRVVCIVYQGKVVQFERTTSIKPVNTPQQFIENL
jgi:hypothetical protein